MKTKARSYINPATFAGGAFMEKLNDAILKVADNIQDVNTDATAKRVITVQITFKPNKSRQTANANIAVSMKLAPTESIDTQIAMGKNLRTDELEVAEYDGQVFGQMRLDDAVADAPAEQQSSQPLDLRERKNLITIDKSTGEVLAEG